MAISISWISICRNYDKIIKLFNIRQTCYSISLKVHGPITKNGDFYANDVSSPKKSWLQFSVKSVKPFG